MATPEGISEGLWRAIHGARLWSGASDESLEWLARQARIAEFAKGDLIFREAEIPADVGLILDGHARALYLQAGRIVSVETYWPGDVVGSISTLAGIGLESDIEALEPMSLALIPVGALKDLLSSEPAVAMSVIDDLARRWVSAIGVAKRSSLDVPGRIAEYLHGLAHTRLGDDAYSVEIPVPRVELAALLGTTPETLSRAFHTMEQDGVIEAHDRMIIVPSGTALLDYGRGDDGPDAAPEG